MPHAPDLNRPALSPDPLPAASGRVFSCPFRDHPGDSHAVHEERVAEQTRPSDYEASGVGEACDDWGKQCPRDVDKITSDQKQTSAAIRTQRYARGGEEGRGKLGQGNTDPKRSLRTAGGGCATNPVGQPPPAGADFKSDPYKDSKDPRVWLRSGKSRAGFVRGIAHPDIGFVRGTGALASFGESGPSGCRTVRHASGAGFVRGNGSRPASVTFPERKNPELVLASFGERLQAVGALARSPQPLQTPAGFVRGNARWLRSGKPRIRLRSGRALPASFGGNRAAQTSFGERRTSLRSGNRRHGFVRGTRALASFGETARWLRSGKPRAGFVRGSSCHGFVRELARNRLRSGKPRPWRFVRAARWGLRVAALTSSCQRAGGRAARASVITIGRWARLVPAIRKWHALGSDPTREEHWIGNRSRRRSGHENGRLARRRIADRVRRWRSGCAWPRPRERAREGIDFGMRLASWGRGSLCPHDVPGTTAGRSVHVCSV